MIKPKIIKTAANLKTEITLVDEIAEKLRKMSPDKYIDKSGNTILIWEPVNPLKIKDYLFEEAKLNEIKQLIKS
jgi:hypothetical protein